MKKGYYIRTKYESSNKNTDIGVDKKISMQMAEMRKNNIEIELLERILPASKAKKMIYRIPFCNPYPVYFENIDFSHIDFLYIRHVYADAGFIKFLKRVKQENPNILILLELPTYPYSGELKRFWMNYTIYQRDNLYQKKLKNYVDRIITFSNDEYIFDIPTIQTRNGIDIQSIRPRNIHLVNDTLHLIGVANLAYWHGYDRVIMGLYEYYQQKLDNVQNIVFHIVGNPDSEAGKHCQTLVQQYNLQKHVIFHGELYGEALDDLYDTCDIAVASLGIHRIGGIQSASTLKSREFLVKTIPFIYSGNLDVISQDFPYCYQASDDDAPIHMNDIVNFSNAILKHTENIHQMKSKMRNLALETCDISITMKDINTLIVSI